MRLFTIGYENATVEEVLHALTTAEVEQVADIRAVASSRRPGFAKSALAANLASVGIGYRHYRALGTPKEGRDAAKIGDKETLKRVYAGQLSLPEAQAETAALRDSAVKSRIALLCYERDPAMCHRSLWIAAESPDADVTHLFASEKPE